VKDIRINIDVVFMVFAENKMMAEENRPKRHALCGNVGQLVTLIILIIPELKPLSSFFINFIRFQIDDGPDYSKFR
jgi:hypothetical protein